MLIAVFNRQANIGQTNRLVSLCRILFVLAILLLSNCASEPGKTAADNKLTPEQLYLEGKQALDNGDYESAIEHFEQLEARFPFGPYAQKAQLDAIYAHYKQDEPDAAVAAADRFIKLYPRNERVDYAYYLKGLARFNEGFGTFEQMMSMDPAYRDPRAAQESFQYFSELAQQFPASEYTVDAKQRMIYLRNNLARHEIYVARYYLNRHAYLAAVNRAKYVLEDLPQSSQIPEALVTMASAYRGLGLDDLAEDTQRVLALNYPNYPEVKQVTTAQKTPGETVTTERTVAHGPQGGSPARETRATLTSNVPQAVPLAVSQTGNPASGAGSGSNVTTEVLAATGTVAAAGQSDTEPGNNEAAATMAAPPVPGNPPRAGGQTRQEAAAPAPRMIDLQHEHLLNATPSDYTIQLLSVDNEQAIVRFVNKYKLNDKARYFYSNSNGRSWYSLVYGIYHTRPEAQQALEFLPGELRKAHPWIRSMTAIQQLIRAGQFD